VPLPQPNPSSRLQALDSMPAAAYESYLDQVIEEAYHYGVDDAFLPSFKLGFIVGVVAMTIAFAAVAIFWL
jgi:hypothetical protein